MAKLLSTCIDLTIFLSTYQLIEFLFYKNRFCIHSVLIFLNYFATT